MQGLNSSSPLLSATCSICASLPNISQWGIGAVFKPLLMIRMAGKVCDLVLLFINCLKPAHCYFFSVSGAGEAIQPVIRNEAHFSVGAPRLSHQDIIRQPNNSPMRPTRTNSARLETPNGIDTKKILSVMLFEVGLFTMKTISSLGQDSVALES